MSKTKGERSFSQDDVNHIVEERLARDRQERRSDTRVVSEPRVYGLESPHTYYGDLAAAAVDPTGLTNRGAHERIERYSLEIAHELEARSAEGAYADRVLRELTREDDPDVHERRYSQCVKEIRALTTGGGTTASGTTGGAAFVAPYFLLTQWALFRGANRTFADCCHNLPLPPWGMQIDVPTFSTASGEAQVINEGQGVTEVDPQTVLQQAQVTTITGQISLSQQFNDRGFSGSGVTDTLIYGQLQQQLEEKVDVFTINTTLGLGGSVTGAASFGTNSLANFFQDLARGRENVTDTAGTRLKPTHFFTTSDMYSFVTRQTASTGAPFLFPIYRPSWDPPPTMQNDPSSRDAMKNFTGTVLPGGLLWFTDDNIPPVGANTQLIISATDAAVLLLEAPQPVLSVFPQTYAGNLVVLANLRKYVAVVTKHAGGTQAISSAAYPTSAV